MVPPASHGIARVPRYSGTVSREIRSVSPTGLSPALVGLSRHIRLHSDLMTLRVAPETAPQPQRYRYHWFGLIRVRSPLLAESRLISLPAGTEMFHFPAFASFTYGFSERYLPSVGGFPHSEIPGSQSGCRLPGAYRRLQRPSSPLAAKASTVCAYSLDHIIQPSIARLRSRNISFTLRATKPAV